MTTLNNIDDGTGNAPAGTVSEPIAATPAATASRVTVNADKTATVRDDRGRTIKVKKLTALRRMQLFRAIGPEASENGQYLGHAALAASVIEFDGEPVPFPSSLLALEGLVARLDDEGLAAAAQGITALTDGGADIAESARFLSKSPAFAG